jgi:hypothetical protein
MSLVRVAEKFSSNLRAVKVGVPPRSEILGMLFCCPPGASVCTRLAGARIETR